MSQPQTSSPNQLLREKSIHLREDGGSLLQEARVLCHESRRLREATALIKKINPNPNARSNSRKS
jgi:hypothetical protein